MNSPPVSRLYTIDPTTGATTLVGQNGGSCCSRANFGTRIAGVGFLDEGTLYGNGFYITGGGSMLWTLSLTDGWATPVGSHGLLFSGQGNYGDMACYNGVMYTAAYSSASTEGLYSIDLATGAATLIGQTDPIGRGGLAFRIPTGPPVIPPVPEPATSGLFALGGAAIAYAIRRRRP